MPDTPQHRTLYVAYTNTDCTEGRGQDVPIATCELEVTAKRIASRRYVQGSDGPVRPVDLMLFDGKWYIPVSAITVVPPTDGDIAEHAAIVARRRVMDKARAAGLTDDDLAILQS